MVLEQISVVLVETSHPGNIGSAARAMKTMGLSSLTLVNPSQFPDRKAHELASGAFDLLHKASVVSSLKEAVKDCNLVIGLSARRRDLAIPMLEMGEFASEVMKRAKEKPSVAIVFGRERTGLTNEELSLCHYHVMIPANPEYSSLNLSQAVQVIAYELRRAYLALDKSCPKKSEKYVNLAKKGDLDGFYEHLWETLIKIGFIDPLKPKRLKPKLMRLFNRSQLEKEEVNILRGILSAVGKVVSRREHENG